MKVVVDRDRCQGHGVCENEAPEVFAVSKHRVLTIVDEAPPEALRAQVQAAVSYCPTGALQIEED